MRAAVVIGLIGLASRADARKGVTATRAAAPPVIDGRLDDAAWQIAGDDGFTQRQPDDGQPPTERTELRVAYDDDALYFAIRCFDRAPAAIVERLTRRDRDTDADKVTIDISPGDDRRTAYHFGVNVTGVQVDGLRADDGEPSLDWDGLWTAATSRDATGWIAELRIPLATLRIDAVSPRIGLQVRRVLQRRQELTEWAHIPMTVSGEVAHYGTLDGVRDLAARPPLYVTPYVAGVLTARAKQATSNGVDPALRVGGDLTFGVGTGLTADVTVNPDFGEVEADQVTLNLTTFETLLPEKRPFFLAGASAFVTPFQQFYSRRIGRVPPAPSGELVDPLAASRIWGAAKVTGTLASGLTIGVQDALTARRDVDVVDSDGARGQRLVDPLTNFGVLRVQQALGGSSAAGVMLTSVTRDEPAHAAAPAAGDRCADDLAPSASGRCTSDAYTASTDVRLRTDDGAWGATAQLVGSVLRDGPARPSPDGTSVRPGVLGWGVMASAGKYGGDHWLAELVYLGASPALDLNDAGALEQANLHRIQPVVTWRDTRAGDALTYYDVKADVFLLHDWAGRPVRRSLELSSTLRFRNFWELYVETAYTFTSRDNRELRDGGRLERGPVGWITGKLTSDPTRAVVVELAAGLDQRSSLRADLDVPYVELNGTLAFHPATALELDVIASATRDPGEPRWIETQAGAGERTYVVADLASRSLDVTVRGTYAFSRHLTMQAYAQLFAASVEHGAIYAAQAMGARPLVHRDAFMPATSTSDPDFRDTTLNLSVLLRWELAQGSFLSVFYGRTQQAPMRTGADQGQVGHLASGPLTHVAIAKLSVLWDVFGGRR